MKITYAQNPLDSHVELDETDKKIMRMKLVEQELYEQIFHAYYKVDDIAKIKKSLENIINGGDSPESEVGKEVDRVLPYFIEALEKDIHCGDCTKVACSCTKCHAESILGIDTTDGVRCFHYIYSAFTDETTTINQAIANLSKVDEDRDEEYKAHWERWDREKSIALESLIAYKAKHFPDQEG